jgi:hypothetical protein
MVLIMKKPETPKEKIKIREEINLFQYSTPGSFRKLLGELGIVIHECSLDNMALDGHFEATGYDGNDDFVYEREETDHEYNTRQKQHKINLGHYNEWYKKNELSIKKGNEQKLQQVKKQLQKLEETKKYLEDSLNEKS